MQMILKIIGYIALVPALVKGCSIGFKMWNDSEDFNIVQLVLCCGVFTFLTWLVIMIPIYIFYRIWWLALIVGIVIFLIVQGRGGK